MKILIKSQPFIWTLKISINPQVSTKPLLGFRSAARRRPPSPAVAVAISGRRLQFPLLVTLSTFRLRRVSALISSSKT